MPLINYRYLLQDVKQRALWKSAEVTSHLKEMENISQNPYLMFMSTFKQLELCPL
jgi:hypothetical protein